MLIKNIIRKSAEFLKLKSVIEYLDGTANSSDEIEEIISELLIATNMVNNNIATSYIELIDSNEVFVSRGERVDYSTISSRPIIEIKSIKDAIGNKVKYKAYATGVDIYFDGKCNIEYSYFPDEVDIVDNINYFNQVGEFTFALGVVGEYLYMKGAFDDATIWETRFKQNLFNIIRPKRNVVMPQRSWD